MERRRLGGHGLEAAALGFGCMGLNWAYSGGGDATEAEATVLAAVEAGVTLFDTAGTETILAAPPEDETPPEYPAP